MPTQIATRPFTVAAINVDHAGHFWRDWLQGDSHGDGGPRRRHLSGRLGRFLADGTARIVGCEFLKAMPMNCVPAGHFVGRKTAAEQVFLTNRTVAHVAARLAVVIVKEQNINAHTAVVAVLEVLATANAAKAAGFAVVGQVAVGHPQVANVTMVRTKLYTALDAFVAVKVEARRQQIVRHEKRQA